MTNQQQIEYDAWKIRNSREYKDKQVAHYTERIKQLEAHVQKLYIQIGHTQGTISNYNEAIGELKQ